MRLALGPTTSLASGVADAVVLKRGVTALPSVVITTRPSTMVEASLVLTTWPSKTRATVHVSRRRVAQRRPAASAYTSGVAKGRKGPDSRLTSDPNGLYPFGSK